MSLDVVEGFEPAGAKPAGWTEEEGGYTVVTTDPATGTYHARIAGDSSGAGFDIPVGPLTAASGMVWAGMAVQVPTLYGYSSTGQFFLPLLWIGDAGINDNVGLCLRYDGSIGCGIYGSIQDFPTFSVWVCESGPDVFRAGEWFYLEFGVSQHGTTGTVEVRVNGATVCSFTGDTTASVSAATVNKRVRVRGPFETSQAVFIDDIYVAVADGAGVEAFAGPSKIQNGTPTTLDAAPAGTFRTHSIFAEPMSDDTRVGTVRAHSVFAEPMSDVARAPRLEQAYVEVLSETALAPRVEAAWVEVITSSTAPEVPGSSVPDPPTIGTATLTDEDSASVTFSAPAYVGTSAITGYTVTSSPGGLTASGGSSPLVVNGLAPDTSYTFTVVATNAVGDSSSSAASNAVGTPTVPDPPTIGAATLEDDTSVSVAFTPPVDDGGDAIIDYTATSSPGGLTASGASSPIVVGGLTPATEYTFTVYASNTIGDSIDSAASNAVETPASAGTGGRATLSLGLPNLNLF